MDSEVDKVNSPNSISIMKVVSKTDYMMVKELKLSPMKPNMLDLS